MCFSSAPKVKPVASAPVAGPEVIDDTAMRERDRERDRQRRAQGRQSTILGSAMGGGATSPTSGSKTALGR